jgi:hypothetical protein
MRKRTGKALNKTDFSALVERLDEMVRDGILTVETLGISQAYSGQFWRLGGLESFCIIPSENKGSSYGYGRTNTTRKVYGHFTRWGQTRDVASLPTAWDINWEISAWNQARKEAAEKGQN